MKKILKLSIALLGLIIPALASSQSTPSEFYVAYVTPSGSTAPASGVFKLTNAPEFTTTQVVESKIDNVQTGIYVNDTYYVVNNQPNSNGWGSPTITLRTINLKNGEMANIMTLPVFISSLAYDPIQEKLIGVSVMTRNFYEIDPAAGKCVEIGKADKSFNSLAIDNSGIVYATDYDGNFYSINIAASTSSKIAQTSHSSMNLVHITCDRASDKIYLCYQPSGTNTEIYELHKTSGESTKIGSCNTTQQLRSFFSTTKLGQGTNSLPGQPTQVGATFSSPGSKSATLNAIAPSTTNDGKSPLSGKVTLTFYVDNVKSGETTVNAGAKATINYTFSEEGSHMIKVVASNTNGEGLSSQTTIFVGFDVPGAVTDATLTIDASGNLKVTWKAPTTGEHNGTIESSKLTYEVVAYPGNKSAGAAQKGTTYTTTVNKTYLYHYIYGITPVIGDKRGKEVCTNGVSFGESIRLPFSEDFVNDDNWPLHVVIDENQDGSWERTDYQGGVARLAGNNNQASDWLFAPRINMRAGVTYTLNVSANVNFGKTGILKAYVMDKTEVPWGGASTINPIGTLTLPDGDPATGTYTYTPETDGVRYFAFYADVNPNTSINIHSYSINVSSIPDAPADVTDLVVNAGEKGAFNVTLNFKAPTLRADGTKLTANELTAIEIYSGNSLAPIYTIANPSLGKEYSYTDTSVSHGNNTFTVRCFSDKGVSNGVGNTVWVGEDFPARVNDLRAVHNKEAQTVKLTWKAPSEGFYGNYVDPSKMTYSVEFFSTSGMMEDYITLFSGLTETEALVDLARLSQFINDERSSLSFLVTARTSAGAGPGLAVSIVTGDGYTLPFIESFAGGAVGTQPWSVTTLDGSGFNWNMVIEAPKASELNGLTPQDNDGGMAMFFDMYAGAGYGEGRLLAPKIDMTGAVDPLMTFYVYHRSATDTENNWVMIEGQLEDGSFVPLSEKIAIDGFGWAKHEIHLKDMAPADLNSFRLVFHGRSSGTNDFYVDNISITDGQVGSKYPRVTNLKAQLSTDETKVTLTWSEPEHEGFSLIGYYIYRDGRKVSNNYTTITTYETTYPTDGKAHTYAVQAVYNEGDALLSNEVLVVSSSLEGVEGAQAKIYTEGMTLVIEAENAAYIVANASGVVVATGVAEGRATVELTPGLYIVKTDVATAKVIIR